MTWLLEQLEECHFASDHVFYIDGFPDFTRQHGAVLQHLICNSPSVTISINCDALDTRNPAFEKSAETASHIISFAKSRGISTICITGTDRSPIMKQSDIVLLTDTEETKHSSLALSSHLSRLVVIDALCYYLVYRNEQSGDVDGENQKSLKSKRVDEE